MEPLSAGAAFILFGRWHRKGARCQQSRRYRGRGKQWWCDSVWVRLRYRILVSILFASADDSPRTMRHRHRTMSCLLVCAHSWTGTREQKFWRETGTSTTLPSSPPAARTARLERGTSATLGRRGLSCATLAARTGRQEGAGRARAGSWGGVGWGAGCRCSFR